MFSAILTVLFGCIPLAQNDGERVSLDFDAVPYYIPVDNEVYSGTVKYYVAETANQMRDEAALAASHWNDIALGYVTFVESSDPNEAQIKFTCERGPRALNYATDTRGNYIGARPFLFTSDETHVSHPDDGLVPVLVDASPGPCTVAPIGHAVAFYVMGHAIGIPDVDDTGTTLGGSLMTRNFNMHVERTNTSEWETVGLSLYFDGLINETLVDNSNDRTRARLARRRETAAAFRQ